jgi:hypothetical protein
MARLDQHDRGGLTMTDFTTTDWSYLAKRAKFCPRCGEFVPSDHLSSYGVVRLEPDTESVVDRTPSLMDLLCLQDDGKTPTAFSQLLAMHLDLLRDMREHLDVSEAIAADTPEQSLAYLQHNLDAITNGYADDIADWLSLDVDCTIGRYRDGADDEFDLDDDEEEL